MTNAGETYSRENKLRTFLLIVQGGKHFNQWSILKFTWLLSTLFWYCLVQNENMQRQPQPFIKTLTWREKGDKTKCEAWFMETYRTIWLHTLQSLCQTVYNMHTWYGGWGTKLKMSLLRIDANWAITKTNWLC